MNCVAIIFLASLAINSGSSSALSERGDSPSKKNYTMEELGTCPMNSILAFCAHLRLNSTDADNSSEATVGDYRNITDGEANDSCKRINELTRIAEDNANQTRKAMQNIEQRMNSFEKTQNNITETLINFEKSQNDINENLISFEKKQNNITENLINFEKTQNNITETLINFEKTQNNITETLFNFEKSQNNITETLISFERTQTSFQKTLTNIEQILNKMRVISNTTKNLETEDKENATSTLNSKSSSTQVKENITTAPSPDITKAKAQITFDGEYKGKKVQLSSDLRTATRTTPTEDDGFFGTVLSNSLLEEDEVFQIRIDEVMDKWSSNGFAIGVIEEKKEGIKDAKFIIWNGTFEGTWAIYSDYRYVSGKVNTYKDGKRVQMNAYPFQIYFLPIGTLLGVSRRSNGDLHFYLNGVDQGPAFRDVPKDVYAFVDVLYYVTKISIMD